MGVPDSTHRMSLGRATASGMLAVVALLTAGCGSNLTGHAVSAEPTAVTRQVQDRLATLLPDPQEFPDRYPAVVLQPEAAGQAAGDLDGVGAGASVSPAECTPPETYPGPDRLAVAVGTDDAARATLTVELTRTDQPLVRLRNQVQQCERIRVSRSGTASTVTTELEQAPQVDADDAMALRRTVAPDVGGAGLTQSMSSLLAQVGDVRIAVTYMSFSDAQPDVEALEQLFRTTVDRVANS
ncbi:sensor domain-containing protein [Nocardia cyriacigeorgica]|uniref:Sensor domain-containing protein n=3 Tax=Nocardia cyriacigeorgica TaxID=135487 RepID=A0A6P1D2N3_9NOCA|nr:sensor domain-containing protein [Nocardia cyriacigeorgica]NEW43701.1 sensor domain-containing protein [Nocardia cyriacigeorgica]NEW54652.1 sensor domain-containing protein [Nocardia cyriacigeorgica]